MANKRMFGAVAGKVAAMRAGASTQPSIAPRAVGRSSTGTPIFNPTHSELGVSSRGGSSAVGQRRALERGRVRFRQFSAF
jgi:hypothetical protein